MSILVKPAAGVLNHKGCLVSLIGRSIVTIMCGRFTLHFPVELLAEIFDLPGLARFVPRYNIALTQAAAVVRSSEKWTADLICFAGGLCRHGKRHICRQADDQCPQRKSSG